MLGVGHQRLLPQVMPYGYQNGLPVVFVQIRTTECPRVNALGRVNMWSWGSSVAASTLFRRWFLGYSNMFLSRLGHTCQVHSFFTHSPQTPSSNSCSPPHTFQLNPEKKAFTGKPQNRSVRRRDAPNVAFGVRLCFLDILKSLRAAA